MLTRRFGLARVPSPGSIIPGRWLVSEDTLSDFSPWPSIFFRHRLESLLSGLVVSRRNCLSVQSGRQAIAYNHIVFFQFVLLLHHRTPSWFGSVIASPDTLHPIGYSRCTWPRRYAQFQNFIKGLGQQDSWAYAKQGGTQSFSISYCRITKNLGSGPCFLQGLMSVHVDVRLRRFMASSQ